MVIVDEVVGNSPSEAAGRAIELAFGLAKEYAVCFCSTAGITDPLPGLPCETIAGRKLVIRSGLASLIIATRTAAGQVPPVRRGPMCVDLGSFSPSDFSRDIWEGVGSRGDTGLREYLRLTNAALRSGDFFVCASEADRPGWLGALAAAGRIRARLYDGDPKVRRLLDVASLETLSRSSESDGEIPEVVRRFCASPWRNQRPVR